MRVLLDTNVIIDVLQNREPWCRSGKAIFLSVAKKEFSGCITAKEAADIHFFAKKQFKGEENVDDKARQILIKIFSLFEIIDTTESDCKNALSFPNNDYEDAIMIETALRSGVDCIITRNTEHFLESPVKIYTPDEFVKIINDRIN
ncbi:MAG: PIN domain-containing protein [Oribacterium sp.]|nr:PIN domain-containing protein [Oribacterium sp.]